MRRDSTPSDDHPTTTTANILAVIFREVMDLLVVTGSTLCAWIRSGTIPALRIGKDNNFDPLQLSSWLEECTV